MKKIIKPVILLSLCLMLLLPVGSLAYSLGDSLVPACTGTGGQCQWDDLLTLVNNVITFALKYMVVPIAAIMFAYAGFLMVTSAGSTESRSKAKSIAFSTVLGLVLALAAWLIVKLILTTLGWEGGWIGF